MNEGYRCLPNFGKPCQRRGPFGRTEALAGPQHGLSRRRPFQRREALAGPQHGLSRRRELTTDARRLSKPEGFARRRSRVPMRAASPTFGQRPKVVEAAGIEPASENVPQKALQA